MPTYDYKCLSCGHTFEIFQAMSDDPVKKCPLCGKKVRRLVSGGTGLIFKGSGFYLTDYVRRSESKSDPEKKTEKAEKPKDKKPAPKAKEEKT